MELFSIRIQRTFQLVSTYFTMSHPIVREAFFWFFFGVTAKKEPRSRNPGQTGFLPSTLPILQSSLVRIAIIVIACHNHMVNQTDV